MTVLVTGASSGIGKAIAVMASQMGASVIIAGRSETRLKEVLSVLDGANHQLLVEDLTTPGASERLVNQLPEIDGVVHAAGVAEIMPFRMIGEEHIARVMQLNFVVPMLITQNMQRKKKMRQGGSLLFITAIADHAAPAGSAIYSASKAATTTAVKSLALELARQKIRANCLAPGYVRTPMFEQITASTSLKEYLNLIPLGVLEPEQIAFSAIYLLSPAARWITRSMLVVDGGLTLPMR